MDPESSWEEIKSFRIEERARESVSVCVTLQLSLLNIECYCRWELTLLLCSFGMVLGKTISFLNDSKRWTRYILFCLLTDGKNILGGETSSQPLFLLFGAKTKLK